ncbi:MAG TPA: hypothetical protein DCZ94_01405 [Lentisphaeria bacterium]|nr:MAG: hypothetical protein A2X48_11375 [Lentisphaerae bacterium GWF2_49_21]HBC85587.1 hypothetical protein [Lentisphaeria bacterium]
MPSFEFKDSSVKMPDTAEEFIGKLLYRLRSGEEVLKIPKREGGDRISKGMFYHLEPEMFIQISGYTEFTCPKDSFTLMPGEVCIIPAKVGHHEEARPFSGFSFYNLVVMIRGVHTMMHIANSAKGRPHTFKYISYETAINTGRLKTYIEDLCELADDTEEGVKSDLAVSLMQAILNLLLVIIRKKEKVGDAGKVVECKTLIAGSLGNPTLNVKKLAARMKCSPDYLSHRFHHETGTKITEYINSQRTEMAKGLLESSDLSLKEIAWACGYSDPGYFTRVFTRRMQVSPRAYRKRLS